MQQFVAAERQSQRFTRQPPSLTGFNRRRIRRYVGHRRTAQLFGFLPRFSGSFLLLLRVTVVRLGQMTLLKAI
jgi:hypothetical protein